MIPDSAQRSFNFSETDSNQAGYSRWRSERAEIIKRIARKLALPLEHRVRVWLAGEIRLEGILLLKDSSWCPETLDLSSIELVVDHVPFKVSEMTSCVRLD